MATSTSNYELDAQFYKFLNIIKGSIEHLNDHERIKTIKSWLEKLCNSILDPKIRNKYLYELSIQVKSQNFKKPFTEYPPEGQLKPYNCLLQANHHKTLNALKRKLPRSLKTEIDDSWYDITDESDVASGAGDKEINSFEVDFKIEEPYDFIEIYENQVTNLHSVVDNLKIENVYLKTEMQAKDEQLKLYNYQADKQIRNLNMEVDNLKSTLMEINDARSAMQQNYITITNECKVNISMLKNTLAETQQQNAELRSVIKVLEDTLRQLTVNQPDNNETIKQDLDFCSTQLCKIEKKHATELNELKNNYEKKLEEIKNKNLNVKTQKTQTEPKIPLQTKSTFTDCFKVNEYQSKIEELQDSLTNLEGLYKKLENSYSQQIFKCNCIEHAEKYPLPNFVETSNGLIKTENIPSMQLINKLRQEILNLLKISRLKHDSEVQEQANRLAILKDFSAPIESVPSLEIDVTFMKLQEFYSKLLEQQMKEDGDPSFVDIKAIEDVKKDIFGLQMKKLDNL